jgi:hypothetical protein
MERQIIVCIPIPGLNEWAKDANNEKKEQLYVYKFTIEITMHHYN